jgi:adenylate cyclase
MAVGGIPSPLEGHAARSVGLGLAMIAAVERYGREVGLPLVLRVGVHTGPVVAGVIGKHKFSYDLWGDTVNIASRMESHGMPGTVQVSEATWGRLGGRFSGLARTVALKGRGRVQTWLVSAEGAHVPVAASPAAAREVGASAA